MKKIILFAGLLVSSLVSAQQITVVNDGVEIEEGQIFTFGHLHSDENHAEIGLKITNISGTTINLKLRSDMITNNSNGDNIQFCLGDQCHINVTPGGTVPSFTSGMVLADGASNSDQDHFFSYDPGDVTGQPVVYNLSIIKVDDSGNYIETLRTFTYNYQPTMSTEDFASLKNMGITVNNTVVKDLFNIDANINANMKVYNLNGQLVKGSEVKTGSQSFDLSALSTGIYIARFTTEENKTSQIRIVKN